MSARGDSRMFSPGQMARKLDLNSSSAQAIVELAGQALIARPGKPTIRRTPTKALPRISFSKVRSPFLSQMMPHQKSERLAKTQGSTWRQGGGMKYGWTMLSAVSMSLENESRTVYRHISHNERKAVDLAS